MFCCPVFFQFPFSAMRLPPFFLGLLAITITLIVPSAATDGSKRDVTGCPEVFQQKCSCGKMFYKFWHFDQQVFVVNCTTGPFVTKFLPCFQAS